MKKKRFSQAAFLGKGFGCRALPHRRPKQAKVWFLYAILRQNRPGSVYIVDESLWMKLGGETQMCQRLTAFPTIHVRGYPQLSTGISTIGVFLWISFGFFPVARSVFHRSGKNMKKWQKAGKNLSRVSAIQKVRSVALWRDILFHR